MTVHPPAGSHPSPQRGRISVPVLLMALAAGPAAWVAQLVTGYALASQACFPRDHPALSSPPPGWPHENAVLLAINLVCLAGCLGGMMAAWDGRRRARREDFDAGRSRFLATCGMIAGGGFALAVLFDTVAAVGTPACWSIAA